jgi:membrane-bound serine protease (ClpP class)
MNRTRAAALSRRAVHFGLAAVGALLLAATASAQAQAPRVYVMPINGIVDNVMLTYVQEGTAKAARDGYAAVVLQIDTPGGDLTATHGIVQALLDSPVPTIAWVGPSGARAASAGTFITLATNVAVMAPGSRIGAATPIDSSGQDLTGDLATKIMQDTQAMLRSIVSLRPQRNLDWALTTVTNARSYTAEEALSAGGIDGIANSVDEAIAFANGQSVLVQGQTVSLQLSGATTTDLSMNPFQALLHLLADPNIAFVLFSAGSLGLVFELSNPNFVTGTLGALAIVLAFIGFGSLPLNVAGLLLIGLGIVLFVVDVHVTNHGLPTIAGLVCFVLGASALYTEPGTPTGPSVGVALPVLVTMTAATGGFMVLVIYAAMRTRRLRTAAGLIGAGLASDAIGEVRRPLTPVGSVYAGGEEWTARTADDQPLSRGTLVRVLRQEGLTLVVEQTDNPLSGG